MAELLSSKPSPRANCVFTPDKMNGSRYMMSSLYKVLRQPWAERLSYSLPNYRVNDRVHLDLGWHYPFFDVGRRAFRTHVFEPTGNGRVNVVWNSPVNLFQRLRQLQPRPGQGTTRLRLKRSAIGNDRNRHVAAACAKGAHLGRDGALMTHVIQNGWHWKAPSMTMCCTRCSVDDDLLSKLQSLLGHDIHPPAFLGPRSIK